MAVFWLPSPLTLTRQQKAPSHLALELMSNSVCNLSEYGWEKAQLALVLETCCYDPGHTGSEGVLAMATVSADKFQWYVRGSSGQK